MKKLLLFAVFFTLIGEASEKSINESWCIEMGGITEHRTSYGTYVDCLT